MFARPASRVLTTRLLIAVFALSIALPGAVAAARVEPAGSATTSAQANDAGLYIVVQSAPPLALYQGGIAGLAATNPAARGETKLKPETAASQAYLTHLRADRASLMTLIGTALGHEINVVNEYDYALNGFSARLTPAEANTVSAMPGIAFVTPNETLHTLTDSGPEWMNADEVWDGTAGAGAANKGEGIVAGIIDTGVNHLHPSFAQVGPVDGYVHSNPRFPVYYGVCAANPPPSPISQCNNKLIGMHDFLGGTGVDDNGHGSHTASTVAGNVVNATLVAPTTTLAPLQISGVAPHANVISYRVCQTAALPVLGACPLNAIIAGIDQATADVPDVVNFSIGGGSVDPWADPLGMAFFGTHAAGVFVAASAGNAGPNPQTIGRPSNSPWLMSVGASTHNRRPTGVVNATKSNGGPLPQITGFSLTSGLGPNALIDAQAIGNDLCNPFSAAQQAQIAGKIVICTQGVIGRVQKGINVQAGGGAGMILIALAGYKNSANSDTHVIPTVMIGEWDGASLRTWLAGATSPQATLSAVTLQTNGALADRMAGFSSRGPDLTSPNVIKPDVTAPGIAIMAAWKNDAARAGDDYEMIQGTSMSSPHAAGAGALVAALHPTWTPDQIKSALMSTAYTVPNGGKEFVAVTKEDHLTPADPFDMGGGRIDIAAAANAGFTVEETDANYQAANPASGGQAQTLNLASMADNNCNPGCSWTRTLKSTAAESVAYTVSVSSGAGFDLSVDPPSFTLAAGATQEIEVTATPTGLSPGAWEFGQVTFTPTGTAVPPQHFPVAVSTAGIAIPPDCEIEKTVFADPAYTDIPPANDVIEVTVAGVYPTLGGQAKPNIRFGLKVEELAVNGELPPNHYWDVSFVPPGAAAGTDYFVRLATDSTSTPTWSYGFTSVGPPSTFTTLGAPDNGVYSLADSTIDWTIATSKILSPEPGDTLTAITGESGVTQPGVGTLRLELTEDPASYTLTSCTVTPRPDPCEEPPFTDVAIDHPFCPEILWAKTNDIARGWPDGTYRPERNITRMAMAAFVARIGTDVDPAACTSAPFPDVAVDHTFCPEINWLKENGISNGYPDGTFRPVAVVTRQAMAFFMTAVAGADPEACTSPPFSDVPVDHPFCPEINWIKENGITTGFEDGTFRPDADVTRQSMAAFLFRTWFLMQ